LKLEARIKLEGMLKEAIFKALLPEIKWPPPGRSEVSLEGDEIVIRSEDIPSLRATLNSFLYWIHAQKESILHSKRLDCED